jgi:hypothetical protein
VVRISLYATLKTIGIYDIFQVHANKRRNRSWMNS